MSRAEWYQTTRFPSMINRAQSFNESALEFMSKQFRFGLIDYFAALQNNNNNNKTHK
jgi:hypothetical protein